MKDTFGLEDHLPGLVERLVARTYKFDVSETAILNAGAKIINVQWDFDYGERFSSTPGFSFIRSKKKEPAL